MEEKKSDIKKSKNIICPICKENIKMEIKDYKINLYDCNHWHKKENLLLNEYEETQNIDMTKIYVIFVKRIIKVYPIIIYFIYVIHVILIYAFCANQIMTYHIN